MSLTSEQTARERKVARLVDVAVRVGATAELVGADQQVRETLVAAAGVREPSATTWALVVEWLAAVEADATPEPPSTAALHGQVAVLLARLDQLRQALDAQPGRTHEVEFEYDRVLRAATKLAETVGAGS